MIDPTKVTAAVKIKIQLDRIQVQQDKLRADLGRLRRSFTSEELTEYGKRII